MKPKALIIGGGVIGCASALELAKAGWQCTLIERGTLGMESSWAGAGILSPLLPWQYRPAVNQLHFWSHRLYPDWVAGLHAVSGIDPEYRQSGMLVLPPFDDTQAMDWARKQPTDLRPTHVSARSIVPSLSAEWPALWMPHVPQVRNPRLIQALRKTLEHHRVEIREQTEAARWRTAGDHVTGVETGAETFEADAYVVCAGAWSQNVLQPLCFAPPIKPVLGQIVLFKTPPGKLPHIVYRDGLYLVPRDDGHLLVGSTLEDTGFDKPVTAAVRDDLTQRAIELLPWLGEKHIVGHWSGLRPGAPDNIPVIDRHPRYANLYLNSGHFRYGVTLTPASAKLLAYRLLGGAVPVDAHAYAWLTEAAPVTP